MPYLPGHQVRNREKWGAPSEVPMRVAEKGGVRRPKVFNEALTGSARQIGFFFAF